MKRTYRRLGRFIMNRRIGIFESQAGLAKKVGLTRCSVTNIEAGRQRILFHQIEDFARALHTSPIEMAKQIWGKKHINSLGWW